MGRRMTAEEEMDREKLRMRRRRFASLLALLALIASPAMAQAPWPAERPVRIIIAWPPGGTTDFVTRLYARHLSEALNQSFVVENRPGGGGTIAWTAVARARPDGYTLLLSENSLATTNPLLPEPRFDPVAELAPVALLVDYPSVVAVPAASPARSMAEFLDLARARPGEMNYGSMGNGTAPHLYAEVLQVLTGVQMTHVPYRGMGPAFTDLLAGRLQVVLPAPPTMLGALRAGQVRALAIGTAGGRIPAMPEVPTLRESGIDFTYSYWYGLFGPRGLDPAIAARALEAIRAVNARPDVQTTFAEQGAVPLGQDGAALGTLLGGELALWTRLVRERGITP